MIRMVFAAMLGLVVALVVMLCLQYLGLLLLPPPPGIAVESEADLVRLVESESISRKAWLLVSWITASFTGALVAARTGGRRQVGAALSVGCLILAGVLLYVTTTPPPAWVGTLGILLPVPLAWLAARLGKPHAGRPSS